MFNRIFTFNMLLFAFYCVAVQFCSALLTYFCITVVISECCWPFVAIHWQQSFQIISLKSGKLEPSLKNPYCSDVCIWRPYGCRGRAGCLCWRIIWDRRCHTRALTGLLIFPVENKDKKKVWLWRVPRPCVQLGSLPAEAGVPVYHLTRGPHSRRQRLVWTD